MELGSMAVAITYYHIGYVECGICGHRWTAQIELPYLSERTFNVIFLGEIPEKLECPKCEQYTDYEQVLPDTP